MIGAQIFTNEIIGSAIHYFVNNRTYIQTNARVQDFVNKRTCTRAMYKYTVRWLVPVHNIVYVLYNTSTVIHVNDVTGADDVIFQTFWAVHSVRFCLRHEPNSGVSRAAVLRAVPELSPGLYRRAGRWSCGLFHSWFWIRAKLGSCKGWLFQRPFWVSCELDSCIDGLFEPILSPLSVTQEFGSCTCERFSPIIRVAARRSRGWGKKLPHSVRMTIWAVPDLIPSLFGWSVSICQR